MSGELFLKDIIEIHNRLFDHRPALQGHAGYFIKEFEEKRGSGEWDDLNVCQQRLQEIHEKLVPHFLDVGEFKLSDLITKINYAKSLCETVISRESANVPEFLTKEREKRREEWTDFMKSQCFKSEKVDGDYERKVKETTDYYRELERKLNL